MKRRATLLEVSCRNASVEIRNHHCTRHEVVCRTEWCNAMQAVALSLSMQCDSYSVCFAFWQRKTESIDGNGLEVLK